MDDKDYYESLFEQSFDKVLKVLCAVAAGVIICLLLSACKTVYVPVESVSYDTLYVSKVQHDSVYVEKWKRDSVVVHEKGDTVLIEKWHTQYLDRWKEMLVYDTCYISKSDTIQVPYPVEKKVSVWKKLQYRGQGVLFGASIVGIVGVGLWLRRQRMRKGNK